MRPRELGKWLKRWWRSWFIDLDDIQPCLISHGRVGVFIGAHKEDLCCYDCGDIAPTTAAGVEWSWLATHDCDGEW